LQRRLASSRWLTPGYASSHSRARAVLDRRQRAEDRLLGDHLCLGSPVPDAHRYVPFPLADLLNTSADRFDAERDHLRESDISVLTRHPIGQWACHEHPAQKTGEAVA
jgi:hypothetical protein